MNHNVKHFQWKWRVISLYIFLMCQCIIMCWMCVCLFQTVGDIYKEHKRILVLLLWEPGYWEYEYRYWYKLYTVTLLWVHSTYRYWYKLYTVTILWVHSTYRCNAWSCPHVLDWVGSAELAILYRSTSGTRRYRCHQEYCTVCSVHSAENRPSFGQSDLKFKCDATPK